MTKLYDILFEEAPKKPDLLARLAKERLAAAAKNRTKASPSGKIEMHPHQILTAMQNKIKDELPAITKLTKETDPSKDDITTAKKALGDVEQAVGAIASFQGFGTKAEEIKPKEKAAEPQPSQTVNPTAKTEPQMPAIGTAKTEPQIPAIATAKTEPQMRIAKTQEVPQANIEDIMRQRANMAAYPDAQRQAEQERARMQGAATQVLPAARPGFGQRLKQGLQSVGKRLGLEETIKESVREGLKNSKR